MAAQATSQPPIRFRLLSVGVEQYAIRPLGESGLPTEVDASYTFSVTATEHRITALPRFAFQDAKGQELAVLQPVVQFDIIEEDWPQLLREENIITLPKYLLQHLAVIATGFARGVLYEKFSREEGYASIMLPIIPVIQHIQDDLTFTLAEP